MQKEKLAKEIIERISFRKHNLHHSDRRKEGHRTVLRYLASKGGSALSGEISNAVGISTPRLAYILKELEADGVISRTLKEDDKRKVCVTLTEKGTNKINQHHRNYKKKIERVLDRLEIEDIETIIRILDVLDEIENEDYQNNRF